MKDYLREHPTATHIVVESLCFAGLVLYLKRQLQDIQRQSNLSAVYLSNRLADLEATVQRLEFILEPNQIKREKPRQVRARPAPAAADSPLSPLSPSVQLIGSPVLAVREQDSEEYEEAILNDIVENEVRTMLSEEAQHQTTQ